MTITTRQYGPALRVHTHNRVAQASYVLNIVGIILNLAAGQYLVALFVILALIGCLAANEKFARMRRASKEREEISQEAHERYLEARRESEDRIREAMSIPRELALRGRAPTLLIEPATVDPRPAQEAKILKDLFS